MLYPRHRWNMSDNNDKLGLRKLEKLAGEKYLIPHFQRGYRWDILQVRALLDDIKEYIDNKPDSFLCLQPIVVYEKNKQYVVIDGQQRLTTLALIEYCLSKEGADNKKTSSESEDEECNKKYNITYQKYQEYKECTLNCILDEICNEIQQHEPIQNENQQGKKPIWNDEWMLQTKTDYNNLGEEKKGKPSLNDYRIIRQTMEIYEELEKKI